MLNVRSNISRATAVLPPGTPLKETQLYRLNAKQMTAERKKTITKKNPHDEAIWTLLLLQEEAFQELCRAIMSLPKYVDTYDAQQKRYAVLQAAGLATEGDVPKHTPLPYNIAHNVKRVQVLQVRLEVLKAAICVEMNSSSNPWSEEVLSFNIKAIELSAESVVNNTSTVATA